ncbi:uncharacterized protein LOC119608753 [Lucilia sericata]|uniref:uncharacterized protein LOC119608753 n=1 Tax=Lucilia sericata TaxID=13632 RepID=UPI0018A877F0|nr:uncharacterized protein LOC119608753 [Lucilia sericata]
MVSTYHPYPQLKVIRLAAVSEFLDKSHLNNFQQYIWRLPFFDFPNVCYSYKNRQGQLVRTGYFYKWIQLYLEYYNASIDHIFIDVWKYNYSQTDAISMVNNLNICMIPAFLTRNPKYYEMSNVLHLTRTLLMVPSDQEIPASLYLILPFRGYVWLAVIVSGVMLFLLVYVMQRKITKVKDLSKLALQVFKILIFLGTGLEGGKLVRDFLLHLMFLFTGIFLTNYYTSKLSSLYASKVYEPELKHLNDIERTDLMILEYSVDMDYLLNLPNLPETIKARFIVGNNNDLPEYRKNLNMTYIYSSHEELMDFLLFQQHYLKHPFAKKLDQPLYHRAQFITLPHRSPLIDHFNRYLSRIRENGLLEKFIADSKWDGVLSGYLTLLRDPEERKSLKLEYFRYAFVIWFSGLLSAFVAFSVELMISIA